MIAAGEKLIELLHSIAMYNDKGYIWYRHSHEESEKMRAKWRCEIDDLIARIGENNFPANLLAELHQPDILQDDSGSYAEEVSAWFSENAESK